MWWGCELFRSDTMEREWKLERLDCDLRVHSGRRFEGLVVVSVLSSAAMTVSAVRPFHSVGGSPILGI
jgi:hypothetical protein